MKNKKTKHNAKAIRKFKIASGVALVGALALHFFIWPELNGNAEGPCAGVADRNACLSANYPVGTQAVVAIEAVEDLGYECPDSLSMGKVSCEYDEWLPRNVAPVTFELDETGRVFAYNN